MLVAIYKLKMWARRTLLKDPFVAKYFFNKVYFGLDFLDSLIISDLSDENPFYVELGANDGYTQSNTKHLELYRGWRGVLIEPIPELYAQLTKNRSKDNYFYNVACVSHEFPDKSIRMIFSNLQSVTLGGQSDLADRKSHAESGAAHLVKSLGQTLHELEVPAKTLTSILEESNAPKQIGFLSLDVEGSEAEVLLGLDLTKYRFNMICIESRDISKIEEILIPKGYFLYKQISKHDYLFKYFEN